MGSFFILYFLRDLAQTDMENRRLVAGIISGALLGVLCIIGAGIRLGFSGNAVLLAGMWYNRVVMGAFIGLAGNIRIIKGKANVVVRGIILGALIGFAFFLSTGFRDPVGFGVALVYGLIIDIVATKFG